MENNTERTQKGWKNFILYALFTLLVFAPTVIVVVILLVGGADAAASDGTESESGAVTDEVATPSLDGLYAALTEESLLIDALPDGYGEVAGVEKLIGEDSYVFYFSKDGAEAYYVLNGKWTYAVDARALAAFREGEASGALGVRVPTLYHNGVAVLPISTQFYYTASGGERLEVIAPDREATEELSSGNGALFVSFDRYPDECTVTVYDGEKKVFSGNIVSLCEQSFEGYDRLYCHVFAKWSESAEKVSGHANYGFAVSFAAEEESEPVPEKKTLSCTLDCDTVVAGEYLVLKLENLDSPESVEITGEPALPYTPVVAEYNGTHYAFIAVPSDALPEIRFVNVRHADGVERLSYTVTVRAYKERGYDAGELLIKLARSEAALSEYDAIRSEISALETGRTVDPSAAQSTVFNDQAIYLGFGYYRILSGGEKYRMDGVDYRLSEGALVPSVAAGRVLYSGYSRYLGNFTVVDHGAGVRTWYCHLSEHKVFEGDVVTAGQSIGCAGRSGFTTTSGVYLMCTVGGVEVSPYKLIELGLLGVFSAQ